MSIFISVLLLIAAVCILGAIFYYNFEIEDPNHKGSDIDEHKH